MYSRFVPPASCVYRCLLGVEVSGSAGHDDRGALPMTSSPSSFVILVLIYAGLSVLVDLVASAEDSSRSPEAKRLVLIGIDCLVQIFTHLDIRRNDFCRLLAKLGLLPHLSVAFSHMLNR